MRPPRRSFLLLLLAGACCSGGPASPDAADAARADRTALDLAGGDPGGSEAGPPPCSPGATECLGSRSQRVCRASAGLLRWVTETCPSGQSCLEGACSADCHDQCDLGRTRTTQGGQPEECRLYSVAKDSPVPPSDGLHDRARRHNAWLRAHHLPAGTVVDVRFKDATHKTPVSYEGSGDSAIWTGSYLAAEALRLKVTGAPDAETNVQKMVEAVHRLFAVTGHPGYLARITAPLPSGDPLVDALYTPGAFEHHLTTYQGKPTFWAGNTSRDQYQGPMLGYGLAWEALASAAHRDLIRDDMITLCNELIKERKAVPITVQVKLSGSWVDLPAKIDLQYVVLNPSEFKNGGPFIILGGDASTGFEGTNMAGFREFLPDWSSLLKQLPVIGGLVPSIPRAGSAIMLASMLRICQLVTKNDPGQAAAHATFRDHYEKNIGSWISVMKKFSLLPPNKCWGSYYSYNIDFQPAYSLLRLEDNPLRWLTLQQEVLATQLWPPIKDHKNVFFAFIHASQAPPSSERQSIIDKHVQQLGQFPPPPHAQIAIDNTGKYPANPECPGQSSVAIDVATRVADDFIWQRQPFQLVENGQPEKVYPGADYLLAYWLGRRHGFLDDDARGTCLRWLPPGSP